MGFDFEGHSNIHKNNKSYFTKYYIIILHQSQQDVITTRTNHIKEGLVRFFCLVPYDVITLEVWKKAMSHWMEAINQEVPKEELVELQTVFCKIFDPDMSPLGFDAKEMYQFISERFHHSPIEVSKFGKFCSFVVLVIPKQIYKALCSGNF